MIWMLKKCSRLQRNIIFINQFLRLSIKAWFFGFIQQFLSLLLVKRLAEWLESASNAVLVNNKFNDAYKHYEGFLWL